MIKPDFNGNSLVNLMSSIGKKFGNKSKYSELKILQSSNLKKNVILLVIDGLGYNYLMKRNSFLKKNVSGKITSVFPSTTATAITTFVTGDAPETHAYTGWYMFLKEYGVVSAILPFYPRYGGNFNFNLDHILSSTSFASKLDVKCYSLNPEIVTKSHFTNVTSKKSNIVPYKTMNDFFKKLKQISSINSDKFIYAYWSKFDSISHELGNLNPDAIKHFKKLDDKIKILVKSLKNSDTTLIITADHGQINRSKFISLESHPKLKECLSIPLCGEGRAPYCYVKPSKVAQFEDYVNTKLKKYCFMYKSEELVQQNYFGLFKSNPKLFDRIGDYILIMKDNYLLIDDYPNQKRSKHIGNHGGLSEDEMYVPLIVFNL